MNNSQDRPIVDPHNPRPNFIPTSPVIEGVEEFGSWLEHREIVVQELYPFGALEALYAERVALYLWRLDRVIGFENAANRVEIEAGSTIRLDESDRVNKRSMIPDQPTLQTIIRYEAHLDRCLARTMAELRRLQKERRHGLRDAIPGVDGADRAVVDQNQDQDGSPGGSPSQKSSPMRLGTPMQMVSPMRLDSTAADQNNRKDCSPGGSPSQTVSPVQTGAPSRKSSPMRTEARNQSNSTSRNHVASKRASPIPNPPPLLASITNRRRLEEYTLGQIFEPKLGSATLDFAMIPKPTTFA